MLGSTTMPGNEPNPKDDLGALGGSVLDAAGAARIGVTVTLIEGGAARNVYVNETAAETLGWSVQELIGASPEDFVAPEDLPLVRARFARRQAGEAGTASYEIHAIRKDGSRVPIEVNATRTEIGGRPAVFAFIIDLRPRRSAEQARVHAELRFRALIERAPDPISIVRDDRFLYANPAYVAALGYGSAEELCAVPLSSIVDPAEVAVRNARERLIVERGDHPPSQTYHARRRDGSIAVLEAHSVPFEYEGKPSVLTMARDVTARKHLEQQLVQADRLAALGTMAAGVAHEINNPLAYVMLNLDWIARKLPEAARDPAGMEALTEMLREARRGAERVATIVRELRSFSRADGETRRQVDLESVVLSAIKIAGHEIRHRARVTTSFEPLRPVWANEARLEQVVLNLLLNAAQAMPEARGDDNEIRVTLRADADGRAVLEVADNGDGIPPEVVTRIFDPFFTTKPPGVGTGLGLSICHGIVTSLGGSITVHSEPGVGTTFRVVLSTSEPRDAEQRTPVSEIPTSRTCPRARVLVVDDEAPIANAMREALAPEHEVVSATSGREALAAVRSEGDFDVLFCDLMMPGMGGIELYDQLRAERPGLERRIVFMTGGAFTARTAAFLASIDNRRIEKPFSLGLVERIVRDMARASVVARAAR
jgi:PAS domain S-box-containing protein